jgi:hypothetical protein
LVTHRCPGSAPAAPGARARRARPLIADRGRGAGRGGPVGEQRELQRFGHQRFSGMWSRFTRKCIARRGFGIASSFATPKKIRFFGGGAKAAWRAATVSYYTTDDSVSGPRLTPRRARANLRVVAANVLRTRSGGTACRYSTSAAWPVSQARIFPG